MTSRRKTRKTKRNEGWVKWHDYYPPERVTLLTQFHAYILCSVIGIRWGRITPTSGTANPILGPLVKQYCKFAFPKKEDQHQIRRMLDVMRFKSGSAIKKETREAFPSLFPKNKKALSLRVPDELEDQEVNFDLSLIEKLRNKVREYKREITMSDNEVSLAKEDTPRVASTSGRNKLPAPPPKDKVDVSPKTTKVNFATPDGVDLSTVTLENYKEKTGARYRMSKDQKARGLTREVAFEESKALAQGK